MTTITPELRLILEQAGNAPARIVDPVTNATYVLARPICTRRLGGRKTPRTSSPCSRSSPTLPPRIGKTRPNTDDEEG